MLARGRSLLSLGVYVLVFGCGDSPGHRVDTAHPPAGAGGAGGRGGAGGAPGGGEAGQGGSPNDPDVGSKVDAAMPGGTDASGGLQPDASPGGDVSDGGPAACPLGAEAAMLDVEAVAVTNEAGGPPGKGDAVTVRLRVRNAGAAGAKVSFTPLLSSARFSDFEAVPLGTTTATVCPGNEASFVDVTGGPFLSDPAAGKHYALGSGDYTVAAVTLAATDAAGSMDRDFTGGRFTVETSNALLVPVFYDPQYFARIEGFRGTPAEYMTQAFTRPGEIFTPASSADPDGEGTYRTFARGFDQMMGVRHHFRLFEGFARRADDLAGWCESAAVHARETLGMPTAWTGSGTRRDRHGFDYLIALTPNMGGGVACGWLDVQLSSFINRDLDRQQIIAVHESAHLFGSPHCDDVGNGSGGNLQSYVMCAGEKHAHYPQTFVWHSTSIAQMKSRWD